MATYTIKLGGQTHTITIRDLRESSAVVEVDGKPYEMTYEKQSDQPSAKPPPKPAISSQPAKIMSSRPAAPKAAVAGDGHAIEAPIPGLILEIKVKAGDTVQPDQVLLIMEAMKMENPIKSPAAGKIKEIFVKVGDGVATGDVLVLLG